MIMDFSTSCGLDSNVDIYSGVEFKSFKYFGNCINTVPKIWDATQMAQFILSCDLYIDTKLVSKLQDGDKTIPVRLQRVLAKYNITDEEHFICGISEYQSIMFIYSVDQDVHYFFDCIK